MKADTRLADKIGKTWSQADVTVRLRVAPPNLRILVQAGEGAVCRLDTRSAGLQAFICLIAFLADVDSNIKPILVIDEAESHLHWDAQADLVRLFHTQDMASQIIYTTNSPGCLPHDLGNGVRAVVQDPVHPDRSYVKNRIWGSSSGYRPLLVDMGASTAALTPHRDAVATEGISDFILLPSLIREATGQDSLSYQIVPGLAQLAPADIPRLDAESDNMVYLTDGDTGGGDIKAKLERAGIPDDQILQLPKGCVLEDLISDEILAVAVYEELRELGHRVKKDIEFPKTGRPKYLYDWCAERGLPTPDKRPIASRVLDLTSDRPPNQSLSLIENRHRSALVRVHDLILEALARSSRT